MQLSAAVRDLKTPKAAVFFPVMIFFLGYKREIPDALFVALYGRLIRSHCQRQQLQVAFASRVLLSSSD